MNENENCHVELWSIRAQRAISCREWPFSCDIARLKAKIIPPVGVGAFCSEERLRDQRRE